MLIKGKGSIEDKIKKEYAMRKEIRQQEDQLSGLRRTTGPQRGDYGLCRATEKTLMDMRRFNNPRDKKKIEKEYYDIQKEGRKYG